jgi:hypothetical protein
MKLFINGIPCISLKRYITHEVALRNVHNAQIAGSPPEIAYAVYNPNMEFGSIEQHEAALLPSDMGVERATLQRVSSITEFHSTIYQDTQKLLNASLLTDAKEHFKNLESFPATQDLIHSTFMNMVKDYGLWHEDLAWVRLKPRHWVLMAKGTLENLCTDGEMLQGPDYTIKYRIWFKSIVMKPHLMPKYILRR